MVSGIVYLISWSCHLEFFSIVENDGDIDEAGYLEKKKRIYNLFLPNYF